jgi:formate dehydrogenase major subunit
MTNHWVDIKNADVVLIMGGNAAEAHPCGFKWVTEAKAHNKARLVVVDPRFTRSAAMADYYAPIRAGTDIAFLGGVINYLITTKQYHEDYVKNYTDMTFVVRDDFEFKDGIFSGYDPDKRAYDKASWNYQMGADGFAVVDPTLENPRCVFNLMKVHYSRYTADMVEKICGTPKDKFLKVCEYIGSTGRAGRVMTIMYALGWTQHSQGTQMIRTGAMVQLLLGNIGLAGGGMNALRGHSNIQGLTDLGLLSNTLPGYLTLPGEKEQDYATYIDKRALKPVRPKQTSYWQNYGKFHVSLMKSWYGAAATKDNNWAYDYLPKLDKLHDVLQAFEDMHNGHINGYVAQGFNPLSSFPNKAKIGASLAKLKFLVVIDPLATETSEFWRNIADYNEIDTEQVQTTVFRLPSTCFAEEDGSLVSSSRVLQWHWKGADAPGEALSDTEIIGGLATRLKAMYAKDGGAFPDPIVNMTWAYRNPKAPAPDEIARESNGSALVDLPDPTDPTKTKTLAKAGEQLSGFGLLKDDGSTACGIWIFSGSWTQAGNQMARRDNSDAGLGNTPNWAWAWPANRRVIYNRASADPSGKPWDAKRAIIKWTGDKYVSNDVPDYVLTNKPEDNVGPFIMNPEGVARFFSVGALNEGPFPEHYEPMESPLGVNLLNPDNPLAVYNPAARVFKNDLAQFGKPKDFPYVATSYRLTEHFHYWTKHTKSSAMLQPQQFVEISEVLAKEKGIALGDMVKVTSGRGFIKAVAVVSKRISVLTCNGQTVHTVGLPNHWGFMGVARKGYAVNTLTPFVGDANTNTPEYKAFLVNIEKA